jgi:hypothetical protein
VLTKDGKIKTISDASLEKYNSANSSLRKRNEAKKDNGLQLAQKFMSVVKARPKMNVYDRNTQNVESKNVPELARLVLEKQEVSSAITAEFLQSMKRADWDYTDPRKNNGLPIEKGQVFEFSRKDNLFDMNDDEKVARIVQKQYVPAARGSAKTHWLQKEIDDLFEIVSKFGTENWAEIEAKFKEKHPSTSRTLNGLRNKYYKLAAKKHSDEKKSTKGATTSAANGAEAEMAVSASDKKRASKKSSKSASVAEADMSKKKRKTDLPASSDKENEENLKPASDKKPASESPKKKSALEDSMNLSDYSSDQDEAESPKKTDWDQLEMNSDEESYNSCDEDSSSDEAALPWTDKDDDEWKPEK